MIYRLNQPRLEPSLLVQVVLVVFGSIIGVSGGLWVAERTLPLPSQTTIYVRNR